MRTTVPLSIETQHLIQQLNPALLEEAGDKLEVLDSDTVLSLLNHLSPEDSSQLFLIESLRAALLHDLRCALFQKEEKDAVDWFSRVKFWFLVVSGTVLAAYEGFDAVTSLLPWFSFPAWFGQVIIGFFVLSSVATFYAFDLGQISENLGVSLPESRKLLDKLSEQAQEIQSIRKYIQTELKAEHISAEALSELRLLTELLQSRQAHLKTMQQTYQKQSSESYLSIAKTITSCATGLLFFSSGFFVSQAPMTAILTLLNVSAAAMVLPVVLLSLAGGVAAFALYWYVQRPGFDQFMSRVFGLDEEKIASLDHTKVHEVTQKEVTVTHKLEHLKRRLDLRQEALTLKALTEPGVHELFPKSTCEESTQTDSASDGLTSLALV